MFKEIINKWKEKATNQSIKIGGRKIRCPGCGELFETAGLPATATLVTIDCHACHHQMDLVKNSVTGWRWVKPVSRPLPKKG
ncbi:MAG: hypothetical protein V5B36_00955 [Candidatus Accumulibacter sp. UW25]